MYPKNPKYILFGKERKKQRMREKKDIESKQKEILKFFDSFSSKRICYDLRKKMPQKMALN